jgi:hypothetical protein
VEFLASSRVKTSAICPGNLHIYIDPLIKLLWALSLLVPLTKKITGTVDYAYLPSLFVAWTSVLCSPREHMGGGWDWQRRDAMIKLIMQLVAAVSGETNRT